jgi:hypothetical protein
MKFLIVKFEIHFLIDHFFISFQNIEWSNCSKSCGGGIQKRVCLNKCNGCGDEIRVCNEFPCPSMFGRMIELFREDFFVV